MTSYCFLHQLKFLRLTLVVLATNIISQPFPRLVLNRSYKTRLASGAQPKFFQDWGGIAELGWYFDKLFI